MTCDCRCCEARDRAHEMRAAYLARCTRDGHEPSTHWFDHPEDQCSCPARPRSEWCSCAHCLSWLRRAPRCRRRDCNDPLWTSYHDLCMRHQREQDERRRRAGRRSRAVRTPPRPPHERTRGACSMCGTTPLPGRRRSWCSDQCVDLWNLAAMPAVAKHQLLELHGPVCWGCDTHTEVLELEHVRPLWSLTDEERTELRWWLPYNLQLLCEPCHRAKSADEAKRRAAAKKSATA